MRAVPLRSRSRVIDGEAVACGDDGIALFERIRYTGSPDAEATLGGLVQQARHFEEHLVQAADVHSQGR
jgi:hypothetical protein